MKVVLKNRGAPPKIPLNGNKVKTKYDAGFHRTRKDAYLCNMYKAIIGGKEFRIESSGDVTTVNGKPFETDIIEIRKGKFHILRNHHSYSGEIVEINASEKKISVKINQSVYEVTVKDKYDELLHDLGLDNATAKLTGDIKAPMPGLVLNVIVQPGQKIQKGDSIIVLEAMKMENILKAASDGEVKKILVKKGDKVEKNQLLVNLT